MAPPSRFPRGSRSATRSSPRRLPPGSTASCVTCPSAGHATRGRAGPRLRRTDGREVLRHSTAHVLAQAVSRLCPGRQVRHRPAIADGFYYDFELPDATSRDDDLRGSRRDARDREGGPAVRARGGRPRRRAGAVRRPAVQARDHRRSRGPTRPRATARRASQTASFYRNDGWEDLCRGPHVPSTGKLGAFKLTKVAGAYWRGNEKGPMLQRIYGTAWESKEDARRAPAPPRGSRAARPPQARRRARPVLVPRGDRLGPRGVPSEGRRSCAASWRSTRASATRTRGYEFVNSPHITKASAVRDRGHLDWFADGMFPPMHLDERHASTTSSR